jgi:PleD family two-component response regulator
LGLSQLYGFVRQSSGHLAVYSEVGEGTSVKIYLPRHHGEEDLAEETNRSGDGQSLGAKTILVVEDDEALRLYTAEVLSDLGYRVLAAANASGAL